MIIKDEFTLMLSASRGTIPLIDHIDWVPIYAVFTKQEIAIIGIG